MKIGLALSGGGMLGVAHIGLLQELDKNNIKIGAIAGVSAGAIIGLLYSSGGVKAIDNFIEDLGKAGLFSRGGLILNMTPDKIFDQIRSALRKNVAEEHFYELPVKFQCVLTNLITGEAEVIKHGNPVDAVMASAAYPGVFSVQKLGGNFYIDGAITLNLPCKTAREMGADFVISSSLYSVGKINSFDDKGNLKTSRATIALRAVDIMQKELAKISMKKCDFCFTPPIESYNWWDFNRIAEIRKVGEEYARENIGALEGKLGLTKPKKRNFLEKLLGS
ncbi:MAG: patatin-like phospholipase family protein [Patescibacteria group bacterium]